MRILWFHIAVITCYMLCATWAMDPYKTLGVSRKANAKDIKRAYKSLAREWHPDKNDAPEAQDKFVDVNKAYEILSDPIRRERYDKFGVVEDQPQGQQRRDPFQHFDDFFNGFGGFGGFQDEYFTRQRISLRQFLHSIIEQSSKKPYIIYAYSNYCQLCFSLKNVWQKVVEDLEPLGYGVGTVNAVTDPNLLEKLRISHSQLPAVVAVVEGRVIKMRHESHLLNPRAIRIFARDVIPRTFMEKIESHDALKRFVDMWKSTNRVSVLVLGAAPEPRTRYLLVAMQFGPFARFAYVHIDSNQPAVEIMREALSIKCTKCENILVFNDYPHNGPIARLSISNANQLTKEAMEDLINKNKLLTLSRLSSMDMLDELCPVSSRNPRKLCVILPVELGDSEIIDAWRKYALETQRKWSALNIQLTYVYTSMQRDWLKPFMELKKNSNEKGLDVLVMWRFEFVKARTAWFEDAWVGDGAKMDGFLQSVLKSSIRLQDTVPVGKMIDEYAPSLWTTICKALVRLVETGWFMITREESYPILSFMGTLAIILFIGYLLNAFNQQQETVKRKPPTRMGSTEDWHPEDPKAAEAHAQSKNGAAGGGNTQLRLQRVYSTMLPLMHELRAESYFGMIRLLKPGCRSLVLLVDTENKERLLQQFAQYIYPLRNNKTFSFGFLMVEKNVPWFRKLLEHTLPLGEASTPPPGFSTMYERLKSINPRQTVGTVLALCGWKLYFSIYHPMHVTAKRKNYLGFEDDGEMDYSDDYSSDEDKDPMAEEKAMLRRTYQINTDNVLNGFPNWLDRLLEGSIRRYYIPEWPENLR